MICSKCKYYAPLIGRSYHLSKCLKLQLFTNPGQITKSAIEICKGEYFKPNDSIKSNNSINSINLNNSIRSNELIKK